MLLPAPGDSVGQRHRKRCQPPAIQYGRIRTPARATRRLAHGGRRAQPTYTQSQAAFGRNTSLPPCGMEGTRVDLGRGTGSTSPQAARDHEGSRLTLAGPGRLPRASWPFLICAFCLGFSDRCDVPLHAIHRS